MRGCSKQASTQIYGRWPAHQLLQRQSAAHSPGLLHRLHAQSKQKIIDKMMAKGLTEPVMRESTFRFSFPDCDKLPPPVLPFVDVSFSYSGKKADYLYSVSGPPSTLRLSRFSGELAVPPCLVPYAIAACCGCCMLRRICPTQSSSSAVASSLLCTAQRRASAMRTC